MKVQRRFADPCPHPSRTRRHLRTTHPHTDNSKPPVSTDGRPQHTSRCFSSFGGALPKRPRLARLLGCFGSPGRLRRLAVYPEHIEGPKPPPPPVGQAPSLSFVASIAPAASAFLLNVLKRPRNHIPDLARRRALPRRQIRDLPRRQHPRNRLVHALPFVRHIPGSKGAGGALAKAQQVGATTQLPALSAAVAGGRLPPAAEPGISADVCCRSETGSGNVEGEVNG